jgi:hypothetical protein
VSRILLLLVTDQWSSLPRHVSQIVLAPAVSVLICLNLRKSALNFFTGFDRIFLVIRFAIGRFPVALHFLRILRPPPDNSLATFYVSCAERL